MSRQQVDAAALAGAEEAQVRFLYGFPQFTDCLHSVMGRLTSRPQITSLMRSMHAGKKEPASVPF